MEDSVILVSKFLEPDISAFLRGIFYYTGNRNVLGWTFF